MNHKILTTAMLSFMVAFYLPSAAQEKNFPQHEFFAHAGYGNLVKGASALTLSTHSYERKLSEGVNWDTEYRFRPLRHLALGLIYSGFSSKGSHAEGSDHLFIHYIAPQISMYAIATPQWQLSLGVGIGKLFYRNNSYVFGKPRRVKGANWGPHVSLQATYKLNRHWGIGGGIQYMAGSLSSIRSRYHGETITVKFRDEKKVDLTRLNVSAGLSYHF